MVWMGCSHKKCVHNDGRGGCEIEARHYWEMTTDVPFYSIEDEDKCIFERRDTIIDKIKRLLFTRK